MKRELSPRAAFIKSVSHKKLAAYAWDAMQLASKHDPDLSKAIGSLESEVELLHHRLDRIGAPQYRTVRKGKSS